MSTCPICHGEDGLLCRRCRAEAALVERDERWCQNCLSLATCYISAKVMELDDWEKQRVRCGYWAARAEEGKP